MIPLRFSNDAKDLMASLLPVLFALLLSIALLVLAEPTRAAEWEQAEQPRKWSFPRDHGSHQGFRTEWWYFTGNLQDQQGKQYGYQLTFFREGVGLYAREPGNPWSLRDIYLAHFTITDATSQRFFTEERISRTGPGLAGARADGLNVWLLSWSARQKGRSLVLHTANSAMELRLELFPAKPLVLHGQNGLSRKGGRPGQASYYVSYTELTTKGSLKIPGQSNPVDVRGTSWFDHEFGSNQLCQDQVGWDWFSLHLSDGRDLMLYLLRRVDGSVEPASSGTIIDKIGRSRNLGISQVTVVVLDRWKSRRSSAVYPSRWRILIPSEGIDFIVSAVVSDQELLTPRSTGVTYWEGMVWGQGISSGLAVTVEGYIELTGYAGKLGGLF
jgi:predicted secreted hydrolase